MNRFQVPVMLGDSVTQSVVEEMPDADLSAILRAGERVVAGETADLGWNLEWIELSFREFGRERGRFLATYRFQSEVGARHVRIVLERPWREGGRTSVWVLPFDRGGARCKNPARKRETFRQALTRQGRARHERSEIRVPRPVA